MNYYIKRAVNEYVRDNWIKIKLYTSSKCVISHLFFPESLGY